MRTRSVPSSSFSAAPSVQLAYICTVAVMLPWVSMAPLGWPVVPPVYCRMAASPAASLTRYGRAPPSFPHPSQKPPCCSSSPPPPHSSPPPTPHPPTPATRPPTHRAAPPPTHPPHPPHL